MATSRKKIRDFVLERFRRPLPAFTLMEILVVIFIIGILITLTFVAITPIQRKARDARRKADVNSFLAAANLFKADFKIYPNPTFYLGSYGISANNEANSNYALEGDIPNCNSATIGATANFLNLNGSTIATSGKPTTAELGAADATPPGQPLTLQPGFTSVNNFLICFRYIDKVLTDPKPQNGAAPVDQYQYRVSFDYSDILVAAELENSTTDVDSTQLFTDSAATNYKRYYKGSGVVVRHLDDSSDTPGFFSAQTGTSSDGNYLYQCKVDNSHNPISRDNRIDNEPVIVDNLSSSGPKLTVAGSLQDDINLNRAASVSVVGKYAYVAATASNALNVIDISNPTAPVRTGTLTDATNLNSAYSVAVSGHYAYVTAYYGNRLTVIDVANPAAPVMTTSIHDDTNLSIPSSVYISGHYAYVTSNGSGRLTIFDLSNPAVPVLASSFLDVNDLLKANSVFVSGNYAYVTTGASNNHFTIINVANPAAPVLAGSLYDPTNLTEALSVYVSGHYAYVTAFTANRLTVIDVTNPAAPVLAGSLNDDTNLKSPTSVFVTGRYAYVAAYYGNRLSVIDISNPTTPTLVGSLLDATNLYHPNSVYILGQYAYVADYYDGNRLTIVDISGSGYGPNPSCENSLVGLDVKPSN